MHSYQTRQTFCITFWRRYVIALQAELNEVKNST
jgi:hypothetical protein